MYAFGSQDSCGIRVLSPSKDPTVTQSYYNTVNVSSLNILSMYEPVSTTIYNLQHCDCEYVSEYCLTSNQHIISHFYCTSSYASAVLAVVILSVYPSVCHTHALWQNQTMHCRFLIPHENAITLVFWHQQWLVSDAPSIWNLRSKWPTPFEKCRLQQISTYNVSTTRDSEKRNWAIQIQH